MLVASAALAACGASDAAGTVAPTVDVGGGVDASAGSDSGASDGAGATDTVAQDTGAAADAAASDAGPGPDVHQVAGVKPDEVFVLPEAVVAKRFLALGGDLAVWVERPEGQPPRLVAWDLAAPAGTLPVTLSPPYLVAPRQLATDGTWIAYVDEPWGDADVFALRVADGAWRTVAAGVGVQERPAIRGGVVAWQDCRDCPLGPAKDGAPDLFTRDIAANAGEQRVTDDLAADFAPSFGTLADGSVALAWLVGADTLRVLSPPGAGVDAAFPAAGPSGSVAVTQGFLASRPSPAIINPDSMMPSDVVLTQVPSGQTRVASVHAELAPDAPPALAAAAGRVAWLESVPSPSPSTQRRVRVVAVADPATVLGEASARDITEVALSAGWLGFVAPRADNADAPDVWLLPLP